MTSTESKGDVHIMCITMMCVYRYSVRKGYEKLSICGGTSI